MTATNIWPVESPLNATHEAYDDYYDETEYEAGYMTVPMVNIKQRMFVILIVVTVALFTFGLGVAPKILDYSALAEAPAPVAMMANTATAAQTAVAASEPVAAAAVSAAPAANGQIATFFSPEVQYWTPQIVKWAGQHSLDPNMVATVMQIESCGDPQALSSAGAQGLFQVMPFHFLTGEDAFNPDTNALRGMNYLAERLVQTRGDTGKAFAGYNGGHVAAGSNYESWAAETQRYFVWATGIYGDAQAGLDSSQTLQKWMAAGGASLCSQAAARLGLR